MNCYFCKQSALYSLTGFNHYCLGCALEHDLDDVCTAFDDEAAPLYAHAYVTINTKSYHIRWHLQENCIMIINKIEDEYDESFLTVMTIPNLHSLNLANLKDKLKIYLTFL